MYERRTLRRTPRSRGFEPLEKRTMFAAINLPAVQMPPNELIESRLWNAVQDVALHGAQGSLLQSGAARLDAQQRIQVDVQATGSLTTLATRLRRLGAEVTDVVDQMRVAQAWVPLDKIQQISLLPAVQAVRLPSYAIFNVTSAGDGILNADDVRNQFAAQGITGAGVKVGVISNGVAHLANAAAELPAVTVGNVGSGDEGTAMLEIVHDLAPGASLYFYGITNSTQMIPAVNYLVGQGCTVIIDDVGFPGESYFSDSAIAQHIGTVVANNNVVYVTAAGNSSDKGHYQGQYVQGLSATAGGRLHQFGSAGQDVNEIVIPNGSSFQAFLQWSDPWGGSSNNYNLYLYNSNTFAQLASSTNAQSGSAGHLPFEAISYTNNTGSAVQAQIWIERINGAASRELELFMYGNSTASFETDGDAIFGQQAVESVMTVAAANAGSPNSVTAYSSRGGSTIYSNFATQTKSIRQTLDGTAIDGVQTLIGGLGFFANPFYGTSAAAPHAGAIAALVRQVNPSLSPAQVIQTMADTAIDLGAAGYDTISGAGRYDALGAVYKAFTPSAPDLTAASDLGVSNTDNLTSDTTPTFTGTVPAASFVRLFVDGVASSTVQLGAGVTTYNLTTGVLTAGTHNITLRVAPSSSTLLANNSNTSPGLSIVIDTQAPTVTNKVFKYDNVAAQQLEWTFSEDISGSVNFQDLNLLNTTTSTTVGTTSSIGPNNVAHFTFPQFAFGALPNGNYTATLVAAGVTDQAGNPLAADSVLKFFALAGDANHDATVDISDLAILATNWQVTLPPAVQAIHQPRPASESDADLLFADSVDSMAEVLA